MERFLKSNVAVIGAGKMGGALIRAMVDKGLLERSQIAATADPDSAKSASEALGLKVTTSNVEAVKSAGLVILSVKPQTLQKVLREIAPVLKKDQLIISIAAARSTRFIEENIGEGIPVIRAMPNTPVLVGEGMTVLCAGRFATKVHMDLAKKIFSHVGQVEVISTEELMDAVTALSGAGPAYAYIMIESLAEGGVYTGIPRALATKLAAQSLLGAAKMVVERGEHPALLKDAVTTPAGVTIDGIMELETGGIRVTLIKSVDRATRKSREISQ